MSDIALKTLLPAFKLTSTDGRDVSPWDYKEKKALILFFFDAHNSDHLGQLAVIDHRRTHLRDANVEVLAIGRGTADELSECVSEIGHDVVLLADESGKVHDLYGATGTSLFAADRFGEIRLISKNIQDIDEVLDSAVDSLDLSELECPECSVSAWPE